MTVLTMLKCNGTGVLSSTFIHNNNIIIYYYAKYAIGHISKLKLL